MADPHIERHYWSFRGRLEGTGVNAFSGTTSLSGTVTLASGATITTPTILPTSTSVTSTGTTGSNAAALTAITPAYLAVTGASGAGVALPTGPAGTVYTFTNEMTGVFNIYCVGGTINGTTGTTAYAVTATGNKMAVAFCRDATGAWTVRGNT